MQPVKPARPLLLASTSPYRRDLMMRLGLIFSIASPEISEKPMIAEEPRSLAMRLAKAKAHALDAAFPGFLVIGSDQVGLQGDLLLGKPGDHESAIAQLMMASGKWLDFHTAVCVHDSINGISRSAMVDSRVKLRKLQRPQVERYIQREKPLNCAGSFKSESLGIALFERVEGDDPTALIGLPLIALTGLLAGFGVDVIGS